MSVEPSLAYKISARVRQKTVRSIPQTICRCATPEGMRNTRHGWKGHAFVCRRCKLIAPDDIVTRVRFVLKDLELVPTQHKVGSYTVGELRGLFRQLIDRLPLETV